MVKKKSKMQNKNNKVSNNDKLNNNFMEKVKIKRVKRNKKPISTKEKILAGFGVASSLGGLAGGVVQKPPTKPAIVASQTKSQKSAMQKAGDLVSRYLGVPKTKAFSDESFNPYIQGQDTGGMNNVMGVHIGLEGQGGFGGGNTTGVYLVNANNPNIILPGNFSSAEGAIGAQSSVSGGFAQSMANTTANTTDAIKYGLMQSGNLTPVDDGSGNYSLNIDGKATVISQTQLNQLVNNISGGQDTNTAISTTVQNVTAQQNLQNLQYSVAALTDQGYKVDQVGNNFQVSNDKGSAVVSADQLVNLVGNNSQVDSIITAQTDQTIQNLNSTTNNSPQAIYGNFYTPDPITINSNNFDISSTPSPAPIVDDVAPTKPQPILQENFIDPLASSNNILNYINSPTQFEPIVGYDVIGGNIGSNGIPTDYTPSITPAQGVETGYVDNLTTLNNLASNINNSLLNNPYINQSIYNLVGNTNNNTEIYLVNGNLVTKNGEKYDPNTMGTLNNDVLGSVQNSITVSDKNTGPDYIASNIPTNLNNPNLSENVDQNLNNDHIYTNLNWMKIEPNISGQTNLADKNNSDLNVSYDSTNKIDLANEWLDNTESTTSADGQAEGLEPKIDVSNLPTNHYNIIPSNITIDATRDNETQTTEPIVTTVTSKGMAPDQNNDEIPPIQISAQALGAGQTADNVINKLNLGPMDEVSDINAEEMAAGAAASNFKITPIYNAVDDPENPANVTGRITTEVVGTADNSSGETSSTEQQDLNKTSLTDNIVGPKFYQEPEVLSDGQNITVQSLDGNIKTVQIGNQTIWVDNQTGEAIDANGESVILTSDQTSQILNSKASNIKVAETPSLVNNNSTNNIVSSTRSIGSTSTNNETNASQKTFTVNILDDTGSSTDQKMTITQVGSSDNGIYVADDGTGKKTFWIFDKQNQIYADTGVVVPSGYKENVEIMKDGSSMIQIGNGIFINAGNGGDGHVYIQKNSSTFNYTDLTANQLTQNFDSTAGTQTNYVVGKNNTSLYVYSGNILNDSSGNLYIKDEKNKVTPLGVKMDGNTGTFGVGSSQNLAVKFINSVQSNAQVSAATLKAKNYISGSQNSPDEVEVVNTDGTPGAETLKKISNGIYQGQDGTVYIQKGDNFNPTNLETSQFLQTRSNLVEEISEYTIGKNNNPLYYFNNNTLVDSSGNLYSLATDSEGNLVPQSSGLKYNLTTGNIELGAQAGLWAKINSGIGSASSAQASLESKAMKLISGNKSTDSNNDSNVELQDGTMLVKVSDGVYIDQKTNEIYSLTKRNTYLQTGVNASDFWSSSSQIAKTIKGPNGSTLTQVGDNLYVDSNSQLIYQQTQNGLWLTGISMTGTNLGTSFDTLSSSQYIPNTNLNLEKANALGMIQAAGEGAYSTAKGIFKNPLKAITLASTPAAAGMVIGAGAAKNEIDYLSSWTSQVINWAKTNDQANGVLTYKDSAGNTMPVTAKINNQTVNLDKFTVQSILAGTNGEQNLKDIINQVKNPSP